MFAKLKSMVKILDKITPGASRSFAWELLITALLFPASILVNRNLGAADRGIFSLVILIPSTVITLGSCQWDRIAKSLVTSKQISSNEAWRRTVFYTKYLSFIFIPIGIICCLLYGSLNFEDRLLSAAYCLTFPVIILSGTLSAIYIGAGSVNGQYLTKFSYQVSYLVLIFILSFLHQINIVSLVVTNFTIWLTSLIVGLTQRNTILSGDTGTVSPSFNPLLKGFLPYVFESFSLNAEIWAFSLFSSVTTLGQYAGILGLMQPVGLVSNALLSGSTAHLDWTNSKLISKYLFKVVTLMSILFFVLTFSSILIGEEVLDFVLGGSFTQGIWMIPWIAAVVILKAISTQFHFSLQLSARESAYLKVQTLDSILRASLTVILGWKFSEVGILSGCIVSSLAKCVICRLLIY